MIKYGLSQIVIGKINHILASHHEVEQAVIYGSRAKGNHKPGSDIDLTLIGKGLNLDVLNKISSEIDDLLLPYTIDLSIFTHIKNQDLINHISRVGLLFYKTETNTKP